MKLYIRTITGESFDMPNAQATLKVRDIKQNLTASFAASTLQLCHKGRILNEDDKTLADYAVNDGGLLVIAGRKLLSAAPGSAALPPPAAGGSSFGSAAAANAAGQRSGADSATATATVGLMAASTSVSGSSALLPNAVPGMPVQVPPPMPPAPPTPPAPVPRQRRRSTSPRRRDSRTPPRNCDGDSRNNRNSPRRRSETPPRRRQNSDRGGGSDNEGNAWFATNSGGTGSNGGSSSSTTTSTRSSRSRRSSGGDDGRARRAAPVADRVSPPRRLSPGTRIRRSSVGGERRDSPVATPLRAPPPPPPPPQPQNAPSEPSAEVSMIMDMGFSDRPAIENALRRSNNNVEAAIELLLSG